MKKLLLLCLLFQCCKTVEKVNLPYSYETAQFGLGNRAVIFIHHADEHYWCHRMREEFKDEQLRAYIVAHYDFGEFEVKGLQATRTLEADFYAPAGRQLSANFLGNTNILADKVREQVLVHLTVDNVQFPVLMVFDWTKPKTHHLVTYERGFKKAREILTLLQKYNQNGVLTIK